MSVANFTSISVHPLGRRGELAAGNEKDPHCWLCNDPIVLGTHVERSTPAIDRDIDKSEGDPGGNGIAGSIDVCNMCAARIFVCR